MTDTVTTYTAVELLELANSGTMTAPITARTLRYYTSLNLIDGPVSRPGQPGRYTGTHLVQLAAVRARRDAGRGLGEIAAEFAANPNASTTIDRPAPVVPDGMPDGLPMPELDAAATTTSQCWPATSTPCVPTTGIYPWEQRRLPDTTNARVITLAPGVQVTLTGAAIHDTALVARLTAASNTRTYPYPTTIWNGSIS